MNILLITTLYPRQAENPFEVITPALHNIAKFWAREHRVTVVRPEFVYLREQLSGKRRVPLKPYSFTLDGVEVLVCPVVKIPRIAYMYGSVLRIIKKHVPKPDIVVAHYDKSLKIGLRYACKYDLPLVAGIHIAPDLLIDDPVPFLKRCGGLLAYSSAVAARSVPIWRKLQQWYPEYKHKIFPALSGITSDWVEPMRYVKKKLRSWKGKRDVASGVAKIITVCNLKELKNIDITLRALAVLKQKGLCRWEFTLIGDGEEWSNLKTLTRDLGVEEQVRFLGRQPRDVVRKELGRSHIFVMVSYPETFGLAYLEAMATGNVVVGAEGAGIDGVVRHGENGFLVPPRDTNALQETFENILCRLDTGVLENILARQHEVIKGMTDEETAAFYLSQMQQVVSGRSILPDHFLD
jgi:glycosyltransferase involved in cell wall biosynthesis